MIKILGGGIVVERCRMCLRLYLLSWQLFLWKWIFIRFCSRLLEKSSGI